MINLNEQSLHQGVLPLYYCLYNAKASYAFNYKEAVSLCSSIVSIILISVLVITLCDLYNFYIKVMSDITFPIFDVSLHEGYILDIHVTYLSGRVILLTHKKKVDMAICTNSIQMPLKVIGVLHKRVDLS